MSISLPTRTSAFPESWDEPFAEGEAFFLDAMHAPFPLSPLTISALNSASSAGLTAAAHELHLPLDEFQSRHRNYYQFTRIVPPKAQPASEEEAAELAKSVESTLQAEVARMMERWHGEHLPRVQELHAQLRAIDPSQSSRAALLSTLDEIEALTRELWLIHFRVGLPMLLAMQLFDEFYGEIFHGSEADAHALLVGSVTASVKAGFGLSDLAHAARELGLVTIVMETPADELATTLQRSQSGQQFLAKLGAYLDEYGLRQDLFELATPTWQEDPAFALANVRNFLLSKRDARSDHAAISRSAEEALEAARAQLATYPKAVREQFEVMLQIGRHGAFLQEEHNFYIDQQGIALVRMAFLRLGQRFVDDGWLAAPDDIFLLTVAELREIAPAMPAAEALTTMRRLVAQRRSELELAWTLTPPPFIGSPPAGPAPAGNPLERGMLRFFGGPPQEADIPGQLKGSPGSRGVASGVARVARTLQEARSLLPGEILVAVTTMPPWTPLFAVAAAVVTESGGPLSHCAIVAREYGIPAVVGAHGATRAISSGQRITVDGGRGIVTLADQA